MLPNLTLLAYFEHRRAGVNGIGCHIWTGSRNDNGYGKISLPNAGTYYVHRIAYGIAHGWIPPELDHLCRNRPCFNPDHLEPVTHAENIARGLGATTETCHNGHRWDEEGWYNNTRRGGRKCKACHRTTARESARRRKAARSNYGIPDKGPCE